MTDHIPYEVVEDDRGVRVIRGADEIGWTLDDADAASFVRELNALEKERDAAREQAKREVTDRSKYAAALFSALQERDAVLARAARFEAVAKAARAYLATGMDGYSAALDALRAALEATDGE